MTLSEFDLKKTDLLTEQFVEKRRHSIATPPGDSAKAQAAQGDA